ncbi:hypothetical protein Tco_1006537 [Tanacetum coccineum]|uniref:Uncharacterized protein n=1 Tax=Tanacetum coccineum TaxID=301880 RepID=A0ABQ5FJ44_9ASTR
MKSSSQALMAQDGLGGYDWSNDFEVELVNYALMAISSSSSSSSSDNEVQNCSKQCLESFKTLQKNYDSEREKHSRARLKFRDIGTQLNEMSNNSETDSEISLSVFDVRSSDEENTPANDRFSKADGFHVVPPPITRNFITPRANISFAGLDEYAIRKKIIKSKTTDLNTKTSENVGKINEANTQKPKTVYESVNRDKVIIEDWNSDDEDDGNPDILLQDHAVVDSGCSSHITSNKAYLLEYKDLNGGFMAFGNELKFNLFSILQMCDKKNSVLFTESECLILSPSFKLLDES